MKIAIVIAIPPVTTNNDTFNNRPTEDRNDSRGRILYGIVMITEKPHNGFEQKTSERPVGLDPLLEQGPFEHFLVFSVHAEPFFRPDTPYQTVRA